MVSCVAAIPKDAEEYCATKSYQHSGKLNRFYSFADHYSKPKNDRVGNLQGKGATIIELLEAGFPIFLWVATYSYGNGSKPVIAIIC